MAWKLIPSEFKRKFDQARTQQEKGRVVIAYIDSLSESEKNECKMFFAKQDSESPLDKEEEFRRIFNMFLATKPDSERKLSENNNPEFEQYLSENFDTAIKMIGEQENIERKKRGMR